MPRAAIKGVDRLLIYSICLFTEQSTTRETKPGMLSPPVERRPVMSARARRRLINTALSDHPVAQETLKTYDAVLQFSENMVQWLVKEGLREQANLVQSVKPVYLNKVRFACTVHGMTRELDMEILFFAITEFWTLLVFWESCRTRNSSRGFLELSDLGIQVDCGTAAI